MMSHQSEKKFVASKKLFSCCRHFDVLDERANIVVGGSGYFVIRKRRAPPTKFVTQLVLSFFTSGEVNFLSPVNSSLRPVGL